MVLNAISSDQFTAAEVFAHICLLLLLLLLSLSLLLLL